MTVDLTDLAVMGPRVSRAIEGVVPPTPALSSDQLLALTADAVADIILYSGGLFGHKLIVTARDATAGFPTAWQTDVVLDEWEVSLVTSQAALNYFFHEFRDKKTHETITNEGQTWDYDLSANLLVAQFRQLVATRDQAVAALRIAHPTLDRFASFIAVRDRQAAAILEWWATSNPGSLGLGGGQESSVIPTPLP